MKILYSICQDISAVFSAIISGNVFQNMRKAAT